MMNTYRILNEWSTPSLYIFSARPLPPPQPSPPVLSSTNANVNVDPNKENGDIEQSLLDKTVITLGGKRLVGVTVVTVLEEHKDDQEHQKLIRTQTMTVSTGTAIIQVECIADISCVGMFGDIAKPEGTECRDFSFSITLTGGGVDQEDINALIAELEGAIHEGTFTTDLEFCMVLQQDQVDASCCVVTASHTLAPTNAPTNAPSRSPTGRFYPSNAPSENPTESAYPSTIPSSGPSVLFLS